MLPPHLSKHRLYARWCWNRGWIATRKSRAKGIYNNLNEYEQRPNDDDLEVSLWPSGSELKKICTWPVFHKYWQCNYSDIKVRKKGADTCTDCLMFLNSFKGVQREIETDEHNDISNDECSGKIFFVYFYHLIHNSNYAFSHSLYRY